MASRYGLCSRRAALLMICVFRDMHDMIRHRRLTAEINAFYKERETENFSKNIVGLYHRKHPERSRKKQTVYIDSRLILDENNMGGTVKDCENSCDSTSGCKSFSFSEQIGSQGCKLFDADFLVQRNGNFW